MDGPENNEIVGQDNLLKLREAVHSHLTGKMTQNYNDQQGKGWWLPRETRSHPQHIAVVDVPTELINPSILLRMFSGYIFPSGTREKKRVGECPSCCNQDKGFFSKPTTNKY